MTHNLKMAIHIQSGKNSDRRAKVQYMPFNISADDKANVSTYFTTYVKTVDKSAVHTASFRGHALSGKKVDVPEGYTGVILRERIKPATDTDDRKFYVVADFSSFLYWNWDKHPTKNDSVLRALSDWIDLAEALHAPVTDE